VDNALTRNFGLIRGDGAINDKSNPNIGVRCVRAFGGVSNVMVMDGATKTEIKQ